MTNALAQKINRCIMVISPLAKSGHKLNRVLFKGSEAKHEQ
jgi:hypothetical protein